MDADGILDGLDDKQAERLRQALERRQRASSDARRMEGRPLSPATRAAYASDWAAWSKWCGQIDASTLPLDWSLVDEWLVDAHASGARISTLRRRVASLSVVAQLGGPSHLDGAPGPMAASVEAARPGQATRNVLQNLAREQAREPGRAEHRAVPLLARHLRAMASALGHSSQDRRDRALLLVGWFGCLRPGELAAVRWDHLQWKESSAVLRLGASKTDQEGSAREWVELPAGLTPETDPLRALREWREALGWRGLDDGGPILRAVKKGQHVTSDALSRHAVAARIRAVAEMAGLGHMGFSGHSLRRGAVTESVGAGVPAALVRAQSRHRSVEVFERYVDRSALPNRVPTAGLA